MTITLDRIKELRTVLNEERISYGEIHEIEAAYEAAGIKSQEEAIMASDMLDELETFINDRDADYPDMVPKQLPGKSWTYKGVTVSPADQNSSGIRWVANAGSGPKLRSDTKAGMRELITQALAKK